MLSSNSTTKILSNPRVVTLDNEKASFNVTLQYPLPNYTFNSSTGAEQLNGFTYQNIGIIFEVTPHVNNAGLITLDLHPQISSMGDKISISTGSTSSSVTVPEINNQETKTKVMVENGKTLVIAGLIYDSKVVTKNKVPVLGDIPWIGNLLFNNTDTVVSRKELLIFMTPHIITVQSSPDPVKVQ
jgi:type II secretory pathway component GspD/PulD (secretin)